MCVLRLIGSLLKLKQNCMGDRTQVDKTGAVLLYFILILIVSIASSCFRHQVVKISGALQYRVPRNHIVVLGHKAPIICMTFILACSIHHLNRWSCNLTFGISDFLAPHSCCVLLLNAIVNKQFTCNESSLATSKSGDQHSKDRSDFGAVPLSR